MHDTTLLDIKPYHDSADSPWDKDIRQPDWVGGVTEKAFSKVIVTPEARQTISKACIDKKLQFWRGKEDVESLLFSITDLICNQDMRPQWRRDSQVKFVMDFDNLLLTLNYNEEEVVVTDVELTKKTIHREDNEKDTNKE